MRRTRQTKRPYEKIKKKDLAIRKNKTNKKSL